MESFGTVFMIIFEFLQQEYTIYGFTFSLWGVIIFSAVASIIGWLLHGLLFG